MGLEAGLAVLVFFPFLGGLLAYGAEKCGAGKSGSGTGSAEKAGTGEGTAGGTVQVQDGRKRACALRDLTAIAAAVLEFAGVAALAVFCIGKGGAESGLYLEIPGVCGFGLQFALDGFRAVYGCVAAFMWMMSAVFSREYFAHHQNCGRFYLFLLWTLGATLGVFLSADLYTTFIFFEVMSFTSYVWVAQEENAPSLRAAATYLAVAVTGGLVMLMGIFLLYHQLGTLVISELPAAVLACGNRDAVYAAGLCMLFGFGAKAGAFPLHVWLPKAHPVAPAPASALLSGILTKTGIYGILVLSCQLFARDAEWGRLILALGVITMFGGAVLAVFSIDLKRTLACSSMSQIGFILVGIGVMVLAGSMAAGVPGAAVGQETLSAGLSGAEAAEKAEEVRVLAARGVFLHMMNHSFIKLVLFLAAGAIHMNTHTMDLNAIRGFGRRKPLLAGCFLTGALAISGIPFFGGYISKTLLHEGIVEYGGAGSMRAVEWIFLLSGGLTAAYMAKLFWAVFVEKNGDEKLQARYDALKGHYWKASSAFALAGSAAVLFLWGLMPHTLMDSAAGLARGFLGLEETEHTVRYFSAGNLQGALISIIIGAVVYLFFVRRVLLKAVPAAKGNVSKSSGKQADGKVYVNLWPKWLDLEESLYRPVLLKLLPAVCGVLCRILDSFADAVVVILRRTVYRSSPLPRERKEGNAFTECLGRILNAVQRLGNCTWRKGRPARRDYMHLAAVFNEEFKENNVIIQRSLSFGLLLVCVGLSLTLIYLIWW